MKIYQVLLVQVLVIATLVSKPRQSAGILPYAYHIPIDAKGKQAFVLFGQEPKTDPLIAGQWNDFGDFLALDESSEQAAARAFVEQTRQVYGGIIELCKTEGIRNIGEINAEVQKISATDILDPKLKFNKIVADRLNKIVEQSKARALKHVIPLLTDAPTLKQVTPTGSTHITYLVKVDYKELPDFCAAPKVPGWHKVNYCWVELNAFITALETALDVVDGKINKAASTIFIPQKFVVCADGKKVTQNERKITVRLSKALLSTEGLAALEEIAESAVKPVKPIKPKESVKPGAPKALAESLDKVHDNLASLKMSL